MLRKALGIAAVAGLFLWTSALAGATVSLGVTPSGGTVGTRVTITGTDFGTIGGSVRIGSSPCTIVDWFRTSLICEVTAMPPGDYDLTVTLRAGSGWHPRMAGKFTVLPPELNPPPMRPAFLKAGEKVTLVGEHLGTKPGAVWLMNQRAQGAPCEILDWNMNSVTFVLPHGMTGLCDIKISNGVATHTTPYWGTFVPAPENPIVGGTHEGPQTHDNAVGITYQNTLYAFYSTEDSDDNKIHYRKRDELGNWDDDASSVKDGDDTQQTKAQMTPVIVNGTLYLFFTGRSSGKLHYAHLDTSSGKDSWTGHATIPTDHVVATNTRFAAVHNVWKDRIEVYYVKEDTTDIYYIYYDLANNKWGAAAKLKGATGLKPNLSAVFYQVSPTSYVTYLAHTIDHTGYVSHVVDGAITRTDTDKRWSLDTNGDATYLADLGEDRMALLWGKPKDDNYAVYMQYYDKASAKWVGDPFLAKSDVNGRWSPTGTVSFLKKSDSSSTVQYRWDECFYIFWNGWDGLTDDVWKMTGISTEGFWKGVTWTVRDSSGQLTVQDVDYTYDNSTRDATFADWPVLAVVDMPPFVLNGKPLDCSPSSKCTHTEFRISQKTSKILEGTLSAGVYLERAPRKASGLTFSFRAGAVSSLGGQVDVSLTTLNSLNGNVDGKLMVLYVAPKFRTDQLEWYNFDDKATGVYNFPVRLSGYNIIPYVFAPDALPCSTCEGISAPYFGTGVPGIQVHRGSNDWALLDTYTASPSSGDTYFETTGAWNASGSQSVKWDISTTQTWTAGAYLRASLGFKWGSPAGGGGGAPAPGPSRLAGLAGGIEGSFTMLYKTSTSEGAAVETLFTNQTAASGGIERYTVTGYWMGPKGDKAYWVPNSRRGKGDSPWFITYRVGVVDPASPQ